MATYLSLKVKKNKLLRFWRHTDSHLKLPATYTFNIETKVVKKERYLLRQ